MGFLPEAFALLRQPLQSTRSTSCSSINRYVWTKHVPTASSYGPRTNGHGQKYASQKYACPRVLFTTTKCCPAICCWFCSTSHGLQLLENTAYINIRVSFIITDRRKLSWKLLICLARSITKHLQKHKANTDDFVSI